MNEFHFKQITVSLVALSLCLRKRKPILVTSDNKNTHKKVPTGEKPVGILYLCFRQEEIIRIRFEDANLAKHIGKNSCNISILH